MMADYRLFNDREPVRIANKKLAMLLRYMQIEQTTWRAWRRCADVTRLTRAATPAKSASDRR